MTATEYNQCVEEYADRVYRFAYKISGTREDAKDIVQSAFEKLWIHHNKVENSKSKSYLFTCAYRKMIDDRRKNGRIVSIEHSTHALSWNQPENFETRDLLEKAFRLLSVQQKELILLRDYEGYSYKEIAGIASLSESQVKVYLFRARKKMKESVTLVRNVSKIG